MEASLGCKDVAERETIPKQKKSEWWKLYGAFDLYFKVVIKVLEVVHEKNPLFDVRSVTEVALKYVHSSQ